MNTVKILELEGLRSLSETWLSMIQSHLHGVRGLKPVSI